MKYLGVQFKVASHLNTPLNHLLTHNLIYVNGMSSELITVELSLTLKSLFWKAHNGIGRLEKGDGVC